MSKELEEYRRVRAAAEAFSNEVAEAIDRALGGGAAFGDVLATLHGYANIVCNAMTDVRGQTFEGDEEDAEGDEDEVSFH